MELTRGTIDYTYEDKLIRKSSFHYIIPAIIGLVFGQLSPVIGGVCIAASLGEVPFSALSTVEPINLVSAAWAAWAAASPSPSARARATRTKLHASLPGA